MFKPKDWRSREIPAEVYVALVDSLYSELPFFIMGVLVAFAGALVSAWLTGHALLYACAIAIILIGFARGVHMMSYARRGAEELTEAEARKWEVAYEIGTSAYVLVLGVWFFVAVAILDDHRAAMISLAVTLAYIVGVTGRNFGSQRLVWLQLVFMGAPMIAGLLLDGDPASVAIAIFLVPFLHGAKKVCDRLRNILLDAVIASRDVKLLADRFDTALNNMPHGLAMFDESGRLLVINRRWIEIVALDPDVRRDGWSIRELLDEGAKVGTLNPEDTHKLIRLFETGLSRPEPRGLSLENSGRYFDVTLQPMRDGGAVMLLEDVTASKLAEARLAHMARYDTLTGLANRVRFQERLDAIIAGKRQDDDFCVMFVDIDRFKQINDTMGHVAGDALLFEVADRLRGVVRNVDMVARFGADEFVLLQHPCRDHKEAAAVAMRIIQSLSEPYDIEAGQVVISASIGIAMAPQDGDTADLLLKNADMALYRAKATGRGQFSFFESEMDTRAQARRLIEMDLRRAVANGDLVPYFQPLFNLKQEKVTTCEALLRWPHPDRGMVSPGEFIPVAEEMGLIMEIGAQTLARACKECAGWSGGQRVAVNVSSIQLHRGDILDAVERALKACNLDPRRLELEITESAFLQNSDTTLVALRNLRAMGVRIALDDFGTGYSSLSYLHSFPLDKVKLDRSFLRDIDRDSRSLRLMRGVLRLSADLGLSVAVEGVESLQQLQMLADGGHVDEVQGFLFSPALSPVDIRTILGEPMRMLSRVA